MIPVGPEGALILSGAECAVLAPLLRDAVEVEERRRGAASERLRAIRDGVVVIGAAYAAERRQALAEFGTGTDRFRSGQIEPSLLASDEDQWISTEEAAQRLGKTTSYVRRLGRQGRLRARRSSGGTRPWLFDPADVAVWIPGSKAA